MAGAKAGLDDLTRILVSLCGDLVSRTTKSEATTSLRVGYGHQPAFKDAVRAYVKGYNRQHRTNLTVGFPNRFEVRLTAPRASRRTSR